MQITHVPLLTTDQERDLKFWQQLGFQKKEDNPMGPNQRWLTVSSLTNPDIQLILQAADWGPDNLSTAERSKQIGKQPGFCFASINIEEDVKKLKQAGATVLGEPTQQAWGKQVLFRDLCGNTHVVVEPIQ